MRAPETCVKCPGRDAQDVIRRGTVDRLLYTPPIGLPTTQLFAQAPRVERRNCKTVRTVLLPTLRGDKTTREVSRVWSSICES